MSEHWLKGGEGARELAEAVMSACQTPKAFQSLYPLELPLRARIERIAETVYGADGVDYTPEALAKAEALEAQPDTAALGTCMVKTHLSLSHDPERKGRPRGWRLPIRDVWVYRGAELVVPLAGEIKFMPGTASNPGFTRIEVDTQTGKVLGMF